MKRFRIAFCLALLSILPAAAQQPARMNESYHGLMTRQVLADKLPAPQHMRDFLVEGKLRLTLHSAILLTLENNSNVRIQEAQVETAKFSLLANYQPFDPVLQGLFNVNRYSFPGDSQLQGVGISPASTLDSLTQLGQISYTQTFQTGTNLVVSLGATKNSTNNQFYFFNPNYNTSLNFQFTQPLLRNGGFMVNQAPLVIARRALQQSRASFQAEVSDTVLQVVNRYWAVVQARGRVDVQRKSLEAADASYQRDKRALELGALPPLDIYRSESEVASRRVQMIQGEYAVKEAEDALRLMIGVNQDPYFRALDLDLTEKPEPEGELQEADSATVLQQALAQRPEFQAVHYALANDDTGIRVAHNHLKPDLSLTAFYQSNGLGGNEYDLNVVPPTLTASGGLGSSFSQLFGLGYPGYGGQLTLNLPIKNRAAQAELGNALVSRHRDQYSAQQLREEITLEVSNAVHELEEAKLTLAAGKAALDLAQKALAAEQRKYELGSQTIFFVLDAQTRLAQSQSDLLQAEISYQIALADVEHAAGSLLGPYNVQIAELENR
jgi:outer membrane protein